MFKFSFRSWSVGTQTFWLMLGMSLLLVWLGAVTFSKAMYDSQLEQLQDEINKRTALFSTTLLDALLSEDIPVLETTLKGLVEIHPNLLGAEFCDYSHRPLLQWGEDVPGCSGDFTENMTTEKVMTTQRKIVFEGEYFGAIALRWNLNTQFKRLEAQINELVMWILFAVLLLAFLLFVQVRALVVLPIRKVDSYLHQVESHSVIDHSAGSYSSKELVHLSEGVEALLQSMVAEATLRIEREELLSTLEEKVVERTEELRRSNNQLSSIMENMRDSIVVIDSNTHVVINNPAAESQFPQLGMTDLVSFPDLFPVELSDPVGKILSEDGLSIETLFFSDDEGNKVLLEVTTTPLLVDDSTSQKLVLIRDVTKQHDLEEKEHMIAFQEGVAEMSANIMHNIGNTLTSMSGDLIAIRKSAIRPLEQIGVLLERLTEQRDEVLPERTSGMLEGVIQVLQRVSRDGLSVPVENVETGITSISSVVRLQMHSSKPTFQVSRLHPESFLKEVVALVEPEILRLGIDVKIEVAAGLNEVILPRNQLFITMLSLVKNGVEAISASHREDGELILQAFLMDFEEANGVCFSIKDNGIGVKSEDIGHIFNHGKSSKQGGSGNGLHASANFAKGFGGQISLQSEGVDEGALVEVWLPHQTAV
ncbi:MAG: hypothetical protein HON68_02750 [Gammaproteobacteria bacterium]|jgi:nitrogen-specific signal transduction histidine kinase|nr:hypothetical protein [Gammaproteobacteria bacterium]MBT3489550.1 hypothetical protein [Gammaproteobacteria bacterium]MBT3845297.1 hypothetical protein [Gammaproteobacteria bacterium]MBT3893870.1 hypothetical protein [Gammaproteobacteria bacterium]MBT4299970.1 hypothetical protein [Gammaproteobacteria bacterium]